MPEQKELPISDLELLYVNGQEHGGPPTFKYVRLSPDSEKVCEEEFKRVKYWDKQIRNVGELERTVQARKDAQHRENQLKWLKELERMAWVRILSQIDTATGGWLNKFITLKAALKIRVEEWETMVREGAKREQERLEREAAELKAKSLLATSPKERIKAEDQAKQKKEAAKAIKPKPESGFDTEEYYEWEVENRALGAKLPPEAVEMHCNDNWFNQRVKEAKRLKMAIPTWPGIRMTLKTRVRFTR